LVSDGRIFRDDDFDGDVWKEIAEVLAEHILSNYEVVEDEKKAS
jgi:hypothetical protein